MNSSSPAHSSISTTAVVGGGVGGMSNAAVSVDDFHFPYDHISTEERKDEAMLGWLFFVDFIQFDFFLLYLFLSSVKIQTLLLFQNGYESSSSKVL